MLFRVTLTYREDDGQAYSMPTARADVLVNAPSAADSRDGGIRRLYELAAERGETISHASPVLVRRVQDRPIPGRQYRLTGDSETPSILRGDSWEASEVREYPIASKV